MIFTLTDRQYNILDAYETEDYLIGKYMGNVLQSLDIDVLVTSEKASEWTEGNYIMCQDADGYKYWFTIYDADDSLNNPLKSLKCYSGTIDIVLEDANPIVKPSVAQPFEWYFNKIFYDTGIEIGINEISSLSRRLEFTSENASNAEMLQYVLNGFDNAEADLAVEFSGSIPTKLVLNVFKRIGKEEPQTLLSDEDNSLTYLKRKGSIAELATCLNPIGENEDDYDNPITLVGKYYEELDENGNILYYSPKDHARVYSAGARQKFYVQLPGKDNGEFDGYINRRYISQASTQDSLWAESLAQLKKIDSPSVEYEAKGHINCRIGDTIQIVSNEMKPPVMISARVLEYKFNDDDPSRNEYTFGNYQTLESNMDELAKLMEEIKKSIIIITSQTVDYALSDNGVEPPTNWSESYIPPTIGQWLWTRTIINLSNGDQTVGYSVSRIGEDGKQGEKGEAGHTPIKGTDYFDGKDGQNGKSSYLHVRYSQNANGSGMTSDPTNSKYTGYAVSETPTAPTSASAYTWQLTKGSDGIPGEPGPDGRTSYLHIKYSDDGGLTFTGNGGEDVGAWIGTYVDFTQADSTNVNSYTWNKVQGEDGKDGTNGDRVFKRYSTNPDGSNMTLEPELDTKYSGDLVVPGTLYENRNMLLNSHKIITLPVKNTGTPSDAYNFFAFTPAHMAKPLEVGKSYTFIAKIEKTQGTYTGITVYPYPNGKSGFPKIDSEGYIQYDFTVTDPTTINVYVYAGASGATNNNSWRMTNRQLIERDIGTSLYELPDTSEGINLVDRTGERENTYINLTGAFVLADNHATMNEVIPVLPGETLIFTKTNSDVVGNPSFWRWKWNDQDDVYISRSADSLNEFKWTVPDNAHSIHVSYPVDSNPKIVRNGKYWRQAPEDFINDHTKYSWSLLKGEADRTFKRYSANANGNPMTGTPQANTKYVGDLIVPGYLYENQNLMVATTLQTGKYIEHSTGAVLSAAGHEASDFIKVKPNTTIIISADLLWQIRIVEYDANKSRVDGSLYAADQGKYKIFKTKSTTEYLRFSGNYTSGSSLSTWMVQYGTIFTGYQPAPEDLINDHTKYKWALFKGADGVDGTNGQNAITGYLTNEALAVTASPTGVVSSFAGANGYFRIMDGNTQATSGMTFSKVNEVGMTSTINSTGYYAVTAMSADFGSVTYRAVYKGITVEKILMIVKNKQGTAGATGSAGKGISSTVVTYQASTSGTTVPTGTWTTGIPTVAANQYLWTRTVITYTDSTTTTSYSIGKMGANGATGNTGSTGATGRGISSTTVTYQASTSGTTVPTGTWVSSPPAVAANSFLWTRTILTYTSGTPATTTSYSIGKMGANGATGPKGDPTGITAAATAPTNPYVGMLWRNTGTAGGRINGVTYRWTGSTWEIFLFHADNISATNLAAITANLGNITAGTLSGSGTNGSIHLDLSTGKISTMSSSPSETSTLDIYGGRLISTVARSGGSLSTEATVGDAAVALRTIDSGQLVSSTTLIPQGFTNYTDGATRLVNFSREGMILQPSTANVGNDRNSGLELKGVISYVDFHNSPTSTADFGARIVFGHPTYGPNRLVLLAPNDDVQVQTLGHLHVKNVAGNGYRSVKATSFDTQSAYSVKKDFQQINQEYLLKEIVSTDILSYVYKDAERETRTIGFVIDDGGSPFKSSELLKNVDGKSFSMTTAVGMAFGAIKALNKRLEELEHVAI